MTIIGQLNLPFTVHSKPYTFTFVVAPELIQHEVVLDKDFIDQCIDVIYLQQNILALPDLTINTTYISARATTNASEHNASNAHAITFIYSVLNMPFDPGGTRHFRKANLQSFKLTIEIDHYYTSFNHRDRSINLNTLTTIPIIKTKDAFCTIE